MQGPEVPSPGVLDVAPPGPSAESDRVAGGQAGAVGDPEATVGPLPRPPPGAAFESNAARGAGASSGDPSAVPETTTEPPAIGPDGVPLSL